MPWRLKREVLELLFGCGAIAASVAVFVLNQNASTDILAGVGFIGGCAIIVRTLPINGKDEE